MNILFILPDVNTFHKLEIHFGIAYLSAHLKNNGYSNIKFLNVGSLEDYGRVQEEVHSFKPHVVGFTSVETQFRNVIELSRMIKEVHSCFAVCGGAFVTLYPDALLDAPGLDAVFRGECEDAMLQFVKAVENGADWHSLTNISYRDTETHKVVSNPLLPLEIDLNVIGAPDRDIFDYQKVICTYGDAAPFLLNRGCPYNCSFCSNHALAAVYAKRNNLTRRRSVDSCILEIIDVKNKYSFSAVHIWDDLFTSDRKWLYEFLDKYRTLVALPFMCTTRSNLCDEELFRRLEQAGCYRVHMSLESGNDFIRNNVMKRGITREKVIESFELAHKHNIQINASSIIGLPFETESMIQETIDLLAYLKVDAPGVNIFYPYIGTGLRTVCEEYGMIKKGVRYDIQERRESVLNLPHISGEKLLFYQDNFVELVRRRQGIIPYLVAKCKNTARKYVPSFMRAGLRRIKSTNGK